MIQLEKCPLCRGEAEFGVCEAGVEHKVNDGGVYVACTECEACTRLFWGEDAYANAAQQWNRRDERDAVYAECAKLAMKRGTEFCERGQTDPETGQFECPLLERGECSCSDFLELSEKIEEIRKNARK